MVYLSLGREVVGKRPYLVSHASVGFVSTNRYPLQEPQGDGNDSIVYESITC